MQQVGAASLLIGLVWIVVLMFGTDQPLASRVATFGLSYLAWPTLFGAAGLALIIAVKRRPDPAMQRRVMETVAWADWALGRESAITVASLLAQGISEKNARSAVDAQVAAVAKMMSTEEREDARGKVRERMRQIEADLAQGRAQQAIVQDLLKMEDIDMPFADTLVSYVANGYRLGH